jgi:NHL repeat
MKKIILSLITVACVWWNSSSTAHADTYFFTTLAGTAGTYGSADGPGSSASFNNPYDVAADGGGNVYVAEWFNRTIRKITRGGVVSTLAGVAEVTGTSDGAGSIARFNFPRGIAVDSAGQIYVSDTLNNTIRKITPAGVVSTLAGQAPFFGTNDGVGSTARFYGPWGITVGSGGKLYVADWHNHAIRQVAPVGSTWVVTTLAGSPGVPGHADGPGTSAQFNYPTGVAVDAAGVLYVTDNANCLIRRMTLVSGVWQVTTLAGSWNHQGYQDGPGSIALFNSPRGIALNGAGSLLVSDTDYNTIRRIVLTNGTCNVSTIAGSVESSGSTDGWVSQAMFNGPLGVAADSAGNCYVADSNNHTIRRGTLILPQAPRLAIAGTPGQVTISWPLSAADRFLETSAVLDPGSYWNPVSDLISTAGDSFVLTLGENDPPAYYRLHKP